MTVEWLNAALSRARVTREDGAVAEVYLWCEGGNWYYAEAGSAGQGPPVSSDLQNTLNNLRANGEHYWARPAAKPAEPERVEIPSARAVRRRWWWPFT